MSTATFVCLAAAFAALAIAVAFGALVIMLARRVESLAADLAGVERTRSSCPDRGRITRLEDFAAGGPAGGPRGRHGRPSGPRDRIRGVRAHAGAAPPGTSGCSAHLRTPGAGEAEAAGPLPGLRPDPGRPRRR